MTDDGIVKYIIIAIAIFLGTAILVVGLGLLNSRQGEPVDASVQVVDTYERTSMMMAGKAMISQHHYYVVVEYKGNSYTVDSRQVFDAYREDPNVKVRGIVRIKDAEVTGIDSLYLEAD